MIDNGQRVRVDLPDFAGVAGFSPGRTPGVMQLAYAPNKSGRSKPGDVVSVANECYRIVAAGRSAFVPSLVLLDLVADTAGK
jgi:hypothetical protein